MNVPIMPSTSIAEMISLHWTKWLPKLNILPPSGTGTLATIPLWIKEKVPTWCLLWYKLYALLSLSSFFAEHTLFFSNPLAHKNIYPCFIASCNFIHDFLVSILIQGGHGLWKTGKMVRKNSLQGKIREFENNNWLFLIISKYVNFKQV